MKKRVFSAEKYLDWCIERDLPDNFILEDFEIDGWVTKCDGKTMQEIDEIGFVCGYDWMIEIEFEE